MAAGAATRGVHVDRHTRWWSACTPLGAAPAAKKHLGYRPSLSSLAPQNQHVMARGAA